MNPYQIKQLGPAVWGEQGGLLSVDELDLLMKAAGDPRVEVVLEVGHYHGLSTCALVHALRQRGGDWSLLTVDAHVPDPWVARPAPVKSFEDNRDKYFSDDRLTAVFERSETISDTQADFVFYDGDHGEEQMRFTRLVMAAPTVRVFIFDDRDFPHPRACCDALRRAGWEDRSPKLERLPGDKTHPATMTLAWFERPLA